MSTLTFGLVLVVAVLVGFVARVVWERELDLWRRAHGRYTDRPLGTIDRVWRDGDGLHADGSVVSEIATQIDWPARPGVPS